MEAFLDVLLDALKDTAIVLPVLLIVYYLLEFLEYKGILKTKESKLLNGKHSPIFGSLFGAVPQCGFAVISTDLFTKGDLSIGALVAVYISTSDEALVTMIGAVAAKADPSIIVKIILLVCIKIAWGIIVGYIAMLLHHKLFKAKKPVALVSNSDEKQYIEVNGEKIDVTGMEVDTKYACDCEYCKEGGSFKWQAPLLKSLKLTAYIFVINLVLGLIIDLWIGEERFTAFLESSYAFQPAIAIIVGLIPNCASSVLITELYLAGGLSFGSVIAGLSVNAGMGLIMLIRQNKNIKENLFIIGLLIISALVIGYGLHYIPI